MPCKNLSKAAFKTRMEAGRARKKQRRTLAILGVLAVAGYLLTTGAI